MHLLDYVIHLNRDFINEFIDIPPVFWKYYDLYRRGEIDILKLSELSELSEKSIIIYLKCI